MDLIVKTARFAEQQRIIDSRLLPVAIARKLPEHYPLRYHGRRLSQIMPEWEWIRYLSEDEVLPLYAARLEAVSFEWIRERFEIWLDEVEKNGVRMPGVVLLCHEDLSKPGAWCHRRMFAEWWTQHTGDMVEELMAIPVPDLQISLPLETLAEGVAWIAN